MGLISVKELFLAEKESAMKVINMKYTIITGVNGTCKSVFLSLMPNKLIVNSVLSKVNTLKKDSISNDWIGYT